MAHPAGGPHRLPSGRRGAFIPRPPPADLARYVAEAITYAPYRFRARFKLAGSAAELAARVPPWSGVLEPLDAHSCVLSSGAVSLEELAFQVLLCGVDFELLEPDELRPQLHAVAARLRRGAG